MKCKSFPGKMLRLASVLLFVGLGVEAGYVYIDAAAKWMRYGYAFMPKEVVIPGDRVSTYLVKDFRLGGEECDILPGARLVRLERDNGYVFVRVYQPSDAASLAYMGLRNPCLDGLVIDWTEDDFWDLAGSAKRHADAQEEEHHRQETARRII